MAWLLPQPRLLGSVGFDVHTLLYASLAVVVGFQSMMFWVFAKVYGMRERIVPPDPWFRSLMSVVTLEAGLIVGAALLLGGLGLAVYALGTWGAERFGALSYAGDDAARDPVQHRHPARLSDHLQRLLCQHSRDPRFPPHRRHGHRTARPKQPSLFSIKLLNQGISRPAR